MCLAIPARVIELFPDDQALVELSGAQKKISLALVEDIQIGDYVIVHVGFALNRLDPEEATKTLALFESASEIASL
ncbi:MAG: HypC/HybG/HupF family hydrogenase formation chaperone [Zoogloeaceae bacterium]|jgi:hydrogenase expression/formation protein HypC|nr:HypC/HybG/HupF family hydrogenase formation chaperone [Zoogloeaceae bacterium]